MSRLQRITSDPAVCHGQPMVRGLRYPVESLLQLLSSGMTIDEVLDDYPDLERDDLLAALEFGALAAGGGRYRQYVEKHVRPSVGRRSSTTWTPTSWTRCTPRCSGAETTAPVA